MRDPRRISDAEVETAYRYLAPYMDESGDLTPVGAKRAIKEAMELASLQEPVFEFGGVDTAPDDPRHVGQIIDHIAHLEDEQVMAIHQELSGWKRATERLEVIDVTAREVVCDCPMSLREKHQHSGGCPTRQPLADTERDTLETQRKLVESPHATEERARCNCSFDGEDPLDVPPWMHGIGCPLYRPGTED